MVSSAPSIRPAIAGCSPATVRSSGGKPLARCGGRLRAAGKGRITIVGYGTEVEPSTARRLFDLGISPGIEVVMVRRAPLRDPVIYRVGDYEIALRGQQARCVRVETPS